MAGLILFIIGAIFGACAMAINQNVIEAKTERMLKQKEKLLGQVQNDWVEFEKYKAYRRGYTSGSQKGAKHEQRKRATPLLSLQRARCLHACRETILR